MCVYKYGYGYIYIYMIVLCRVFTPPPTCIYSVNIYIYDTLLTYIYIACI